MSLGLELLRVLVSDDLELVRRWMHLLIWNLLIPLFEAESISLLCAWCGGRLGGGARIGEDRYVDWESRSLLQGCTLFRPRL